MVDIPANYSKDSEGAQLVKVQEKEDIIGTSISKLKGTTTVKTSPHFCKFNLILHYEWVDVDKNVIISNWPEMFWPVLKTISLTC